MATTATKTPHLTPALARLRHVVSTTPADRQVQRSSAITQPLSPLRGSKRLHQLSKRRAESRETRGLAGVHTLGDFMKYDADLRRKASVDKGLAKSAPYCVEQ